ncbi:MAG: hypothetical protein PVH61_35595 [Candidatus Aminicenantes bacterium]|jgi:hypothetical protein
MELLGFVTSIISLLSGGKHLLDLMAGNTLAGHINRLSDEIKRLGKQRYFIPVQELYHRGQQPKQLLNPMDEISPDLIAIQKATSAELITSKLIRTPDKLKNAVGSNPDDFLTDIRPLKGVSFPEKYVSDPTFVPVTFSKWDQQFIGFMKVGYLQDSFNIDFRPWAVQKVGTHFVWENKPYTKGETMSNYLRYHRKQHVRFRELNYEWRKNCIKLASSKKFVGKFLLW